MPIEIGLWKLGAQLEPIRFQPLEAERKLENALASDLSLVGEGLLLIKRQVATASGKFVDMLAVDVQGTLVGESRRGRVLIFDICARPACRELLRSLVSEQSKPR